MILSRAKCEAKIDKVDIQIKDELTLKQLEEEATRHLQ